MDMRSRIERRMDKLMAQKRKNWEIEAELKVNHSEAMDWIEEKENYKRLKQEEGDTRTSKKSSKLNPDSMRKPKVTMSKKKETQTLLRRNFEFHVIGSGRPSLKADSAGHKMDSCWQTRTAQKVKISEALTSGDVPLGMNNAMSIATRIEGEIFRVLSHDTTEYVNHCEKCSNFISHEPNCHIRYDLLLGRLEAEGFAFIPSHRETIDAVNHMRFKWAPKPNKFQTK